MAESTAGRRAAFLRMLPASATLLALAVALGVAANLVRPAATRLPWASDWSRHIETQAYRAGVPVLFLPGVRERAGNPDWLICDARTPEQYAAGHLPGAWNLPLEEVDARLRAGCALDAAVGAAGILRRADCTDALELALKLRQLGFERVTLYPGGYAEWVEYGGEVRTGDEP